jgi:hypothetical protein
MIYTEMTKKALRIAFDAHAVPYMDYVRGIKESGNAAAIAVKTADLKHNSDVSRLDTIDERMSARLEKYNVAINLLR